MRREPELVRSWTWPHYNFVLWFLSSLFRLLGGYEVQGVDNIPRTGGALIAGNHISFLDPPAVGSALPRRSYYFAKQQLFQIPIFSLIIRKFYAFPVHREGLDRTAICNAVNLLRAGELVTMFPEGTRSPDGKLQDASRGAAFIANMADVPIIPCALVGTDKVLPRGAWYLHRGKIAVSFGEMIDVRDYCEPDGHEIDLAAATEALMTSIAKMLKQFGTSDDTNEALELQ